MPLELRPVASAKEAPELLACYLASSAHPTSPFTQLVAAVYGTGASAHKDRITGFSARQWFAHCSDPGSFFFKMDTELHDTVVAGTEWNVYTNDHFKDAVPEGSAYWWPPGPSKRYTDAVACGAANETTVIYVSRALPKASWGLFIKRDSPLTIDYSLLVHLYPC
jgi:hypothetical protein